MTGKELLELAAKAVGVDCDEVGPFVIKKEWEQFFGCQGEFRDVKREWNPLNDDGDALRLAVDLDMTVTQLQYSAECVYFIDGDMLDPIHEHHSNDKHAATRRAIVRAAAAIGAEVDL